MMVRDISKLRVGRVTYCCWCDDDGKVVDDGTVTRLAEDHYRVTAADPTLPLAGALGRSFDVAIEDSSTRLGALALQGPTSRDDPAGATDIDIDALKFFAAAHGHLDEREVWLTRTGYTGDLGYEIWCHNADALPVWDALMEAGKPYGIRPAGLDALDLARIEAGFIMLGVDYFSAPKVVLESRKSTPYELGLGWTVNLDESPSWARRRSSARRASGSKWALVGLELSWEELERSTTATACHRACRPQPPRSRYRSISATGRSARRPATPGHRSSRRASRWRRYSPSTAKPGTRLTMEHTVEFERRRVSATVAKTPFFNPERKRKP